uniref:Splicing factor Cactin n=1 Tax=Astyanax mexicanus TaxID=7994 RepID=A0A8B9HFC6_ASTMX
MVKKKNALPYCVPSNHLLLCFPLFSSDECTTKKHRKESRCKGEGVRKLSRSRSSSCSSRSSSNKRRQRARDAYSSERERGKGWRRSARDSRSSSREKSRERNMERRRSRSRGRSEEWDRRRGMSRRSQSGSSVSSGSSASDQEDPRAGPASLSVKEEKKKQKDLMKALETPEEKRARRLAKKEAKERKKREKMGWSEEYMGYTNADNPFGDNNLLGTFKWQKALEKKGIGHLGEKELKERNKRIQEENRRELQKVKQLRLEREREKAMREQELEMLQREKEAEHFKTWAEQEDNFHLHQAKLRSKIRIRDGRAKPIDLLAKYISAEDDDLAVEMHEPYTFLNGLTVTDMDDLLVDIKVYMQLEQGKNVDFWRDMTTITEDEISKLRKLEASGKGPGTITYTFYLGQHFMTMILGAFSILEQKRRSLHKSKGRWVHLPALYQRLPPGWRRWRVDQQWIMRKMKKSQVPLHILELLRKSEGEEDGEKSGGVEVVLTEEDLIQQSQAEYDSGRYSPTLLQSSELPLDTHTIDVEEDLQRLHLARRQLQVTGDASESAEDAFVRRAKEGMGGDEAQFSVELPLTGKMYLWADKYRPRKPRFFNRVHTGFEWNKYNQTHYDFDNPPPKIVQGYKFNIFYPDLIDKRSTPQYFLEPSPDNKDFGILRFHAGPPYEDIAFKIVNREWEYSHRHGFRCQFANGIFQLWFHFKRYRYRR